MPGSDLELLTEAALAASEVALRYWRKAPKHWEKPDGGGPVSEADLAVNEVLARILRGARPGYGWLSEEDEPPVSGVSERMFVIDPIDGTRSFLAGEELFAISLAVVHRGRAEVGVVHLPARGRTYAAVAGGVATKDGQPIRLRAASAVPVVLTGAPSMKAEHWPGGRPEFTRDFRPSMAYRLCLVAEGRMDAMLTLRPAWDWDIAAGAVIAEAAGARVTDRHGRRLTFENSPPQADGLVVAGPEFHARLVAGLTG